MVGYDEAFQVDEDWRPIPGDSVGLAEYLGEYVCREFAREGKLSMTVLRLGKVIRAEDFAGQPFDPLWVDRRDIAQAVSLALAAQLAAGGPRLGAWSIFHILSGSPRARFSIERARRVLGYRPQFAG
jgi:nucleoside-diphosphate-sugar epimerase